MKTNFVLLIFLIVFSCDKKEKFNNTLNIKVKYCQSDLNDALISQFAIYSNDSLLQIIKPRGSRNITIDSLKKGKYRIEYTTLFYQKNIVNADIKGSKRNHEVELCVDYFNHNSSTYKPIVDILKTNEKYSMELVSHGCEHLDVEKMQVSRMESEYAVKIGDSVKYFQKHELSPLRYFEIELKAIDSARGCTTVDYYTIKHNEKIINITDGSCRWNGFNTLKKSLGFSNKNSS